MYVLAACGEKEEHRFPAQIESIDAPTKESGRVFHIRYFHYPTKSQRGFTSEAVTRTALDSDLLSVLKAPKEEGITASRKKIIFDELV
jgi:hypothetical protein